MSKGTYSHSNRHRMHEPQVTNSNELALHINRELAKSRLEQVIRLEDENHEQRGQMVLLREKIKELNRILSTCMYALQENEELKKDKERLDWLIDNASISMLRKDEDGEEWWVELDYSEPREDIDKRME